MTAPQAPAPIQLTDAMREAVNGALLKGNPVVVAYVSPEGQPRLSFRGSAQVYSDDQLAVWVRNPEGGLPQAIANNPRVSLLFRSPDPRLVLNFEGRGHLDSSEAARSKVYENSPEPERNADRDQKGLALIIDLDRVTGFGTGGMISMRRS